MTASDYDLFCAIKNHLGDQNQYRCDDDNISAVDDILREYVRQISTYSRAYIYIHTNINIPKWLDGYMHIYISLLATHGRT